VRATAASSFANAEMGDADELEVEYEEVENLDEVSRIRSTFTFCMSSSATACEVLKRMWAHRAVHAVGRCRRGNSERGA
jgi:hypothetical protein